MILKIKTFEELSTRELYELLRLRSEVFIVEQEGIYQDLDGIDYDSLHVFYEDDQQRVVGYLRLFPKPDEAGTVQVGRLVTRDRKTGMGTSLMQEAERLARDYYHSTELYLTGRKSALGFYLKCGYHTDSPELNSERVPYYLFRKSI